MLVTTNEPIDRLHSAIARPGRSWAHLEFSGLPTDEANDWLDDQTTLDGTRLGVLVMIAITLAVQGAFVAFFLYLRKRAKRIAESDLGDAARALEVTAVVSSPDSKVTHVELVRR